MKGGKLAAMKDAVLGLVDTMSAQVKDEDKLKFAVVPFAGLRQCRAGIRAELRQEGQADRRHRRRLARSQGQSNVPQTELVPGASRFQIYTISARPGPAASKRAMRPARIGRRRHAGRSRPSRRRCSSRRSASTSPTRGEFANSYIKSDAKPNDKTVSAEEEALAKYGVETDAAGIPLLGGVLGSAVFGVLDSGGQAAYADRHQPGAATASPRGRAHGCDVQPITPLTQRLRQL